MRVEISNGGANHSRGRHQYFLTAEAILKYLLGTNEKIVTLITCKSADADLITTDYELYQAFASVKKYDALTHARLVKLFESVDIASHRKESGEEKGIVTHERVDELRKKAFKEQVGDDKNE